MYSQSIFLVLGVAWLASAVPTPAPLNINLGAYSPALVVGDGAISFAGAEAAGGAANAAGAGAGAGTGNVEAAQAVGGVAGTDQVTAEQQPVATTAQDTTLLQGMGKQRLPKD